MGKHDSNGVNSKLLKVLIFFSLLSYLQTTEAFRLKRYRSLNTSRHHFQIDQNAVQNRVDVLNNSNNLFSHDTAISNVIGCSLLIPAGLASLFPLSNPLNDYIYLISAFFFTLTGIFDFKGTFMMSGKNEIENIVTTQARAGSLLSFITGITFVVGTLCNISYDAEAAVMWYHACYGSIIANMYLLLINLAVDLNLARKGHVTSPSGNIYYVQDCDPVVMPLAYSKDSDTSFWLRLSAMSLNLLGTGCFASGLVLLPAVFCTVGGIFFTLGSVTNLYVEMHHHPTIPCSQKAQLDG